MILSNNFWSVAFAIGFSALSYNLESGTREALAYDSLKFAGQEEKYLSVTKPQRKTCAQSSR